MPRIGANVKRTSIQSIEKQIKLIMLKARKINEFQNVSQTSSLKICFDLTQTSRARIVWHGRRDELHEQASGRENENCY